MDNMKTNKKRVEIWKETRFLFKYRNIYYFIFCQDTGYCLVQILWCEFEVCIDSTKMYRHVPAYSKHYLKYGFLVSYLNVSFYYDLNRIS